MRGTAVRPVRKSRTIWAEGVHIYPDRCLRTPRVRCARYRAARSSKTALRVGCIRSGVVGSG